MIIDSHAHTCNTIFNIPEDNVVKAIEKYNIDLVILSNVSCAEVDSNKQKITNPNRLNQLDGLKESLRFARSNSKIRITPWICPLDETCDKEFQELVLNNLDVICGLKFHPFHSSLSIEDESLIPYLEFANINSLPFAVHTAVSEESRSYHVAAIANKYPNINFILVHMDLGSDHKEAMQIIKENNNIYGDTTWVNMEDTLKAINLFGIDKIAFGSDMPIDGVDTYEVLSNGSKSIYYDFFNSIKDKLSSEDYEKLMFKNAAKIYKLEL